MHITGSLVYDYLINGNPRHPFMLMEVLAEGVQLMVRLQGRALIVAKNISKIAYFFQVGHDFPLALLSFRKVYNRYDKAVVSQSEASTSSAVKESAAAQPEPLKSLPQQETKSVESASSWWTSTAGAVYTAVSQRGRPTPSAEKENGAGEKAASQFESSKSSPEQESKPPVEPGSSWFSPSKAVAVIYTAVSQRGRATPSAPKESGAGGKAAAQAGPLKSSSEQEPKPVEPPPSWFSPSKAAGVIYTALSQRRGVTPAAPKEGGAGEKAASQSEPSKPSSEQDPNPVEPVVPWWIDVARAVSHGSQLVTFAQRYVFEKNSSSLMRIMGGVADLADHAHALYSYQLPKPLQSIHTWNKREISQLSLHVSSIGLTLMSFVSVYRGVESSASIPALFLKTVYVGATFVLY